MRQDVRLALPAIVVWAVAHAGAEAAFLTASIGTVLTLIALILRRHQPTPVRDLLAVIGVCLVISSVTVTSHHHLRDSDAVTRAVASSRFATVEAIILDHPSPWGNGDELVTEAAVKRIEVGDLTMSSSQSIRLVWQSSSSWAPSRGDHVVVSGQLGTTWAGDTAVGTLRLMTADSHHTADGLRGLTNVIHGELVDATSSGSSHLALIPGVVVGDDSGLTQRLEDNMRVLGLAHLTAVSGAHVSLVLGVVIFATGRRSRLVTATLSAGALYVLIMLVGGEPSVIRAGFMGAFICVGFLLKRPTTAFPLLCITVIVISLVDPYLARSLGFQLSAIATGAIVLAGYPLRAALSRRLPRTLAEMIAIPLIAGIATIPFLVGVQEESSIWTVAANALVAPVVAPLTLGGLAAALLLPYFPWGASPLLWLSGLCTWWMEVVADVLIGLPGSGVSLGVALTFNGAVLAGLVFWVRRRDRPHSALPRSTKFPRPAQLGGTDVLGRRQLHDRQVWSLWRPVLGTAVAVAVGTAIGMSGTKTLRGGAIGHWQAIQCDVGQGSAFLARTASTTVLIDVGPEDGNISDCLRYADVQRIDLLIISHFDSDHVRGLREVLDTADVGEVWVSENPNPLFNSAWASEILQERGIPLTAVTVGGQLGADLNANVSVVGPQYLSGGEDASNSDSLIIDIRTRDLRFLVLADAPKERQDQLARQLDAQAAREFDVVVIGHHGAADQSTILAQTANPAVSVVSVGENDYGHPTREALDIWDAPAVLRTDECGHIVFTGTEVIAQCP